MVVEFARLLWLVAGVKLDITVPAAPDTVIGGARSSHIKRHIEKSRRVLLGQRV